MSANERVVKRQILLARAELERVALLDSLGELRQATQSLSWRSQLSSHFLKNMWQQGGALKSMLGHIPWTGWIGRAAVALLAAGKRTGKGSQFVRYAVLGVAVYKLWRLWADTHPARHDDTDPAA